MQCLGCLRGFPEECRGGDCDGSPSESFIDVLPQENEADEQVKRQRRNKPDAALKDQQSTGRKRAARLYKIDSNAPCEWATATFSNPKGGGKIPMVVGCNNLQQARHHGPDKNTLNNEPGNVHRICAWHHNNWHAKNDPDYDPNKPLKD